jgi:glutathione S-transferase
VHNCCTVLTFATANRQNLLQLSPAALEAELAKSPSRSRAEAKRQVAKDGLDAPIVMDALRQHEKLLAWIEGAPGPFLAGAAYSLADAAATPYIWRLDMLRLARLWEDRPNVAAWYERMRRRPSFATAVEAWLTPADRDRYANFAPDPWPKVSALLRAA